MVTCTRSEAGNPLPFWEQGEKDETNLTAAPTNSNSKLTTSVNEGKKMPKILAMKWVPMYSRGHRKNVNLAHVHSIEKIL